MISDVQRATPAWRAVAIENVRSVGLSMRYPVLLVGGTVVLASVYTTYQFAVTGEGFEWNFLSVNVMLFFLAGVFPARIWIETEVERRGYLWSTPIPRTGGHLTRVVAGWVWLMVGVTLYLTWALLAALVTGGPTPGDGRFSEEVSVGFLPVESWHFVALYTSATIVYLFLSIPHLVAKKPMSWFVLGWFGSIFLLPVIRNLGDVPVLRFILDDALGRSRAGFLTAMTAESAAVPIVEDGVATLGAGPHLESWLTATGLWMAIAVAAVWIAARVYREA